MRYIVSIAAAFLVLLFLGATTGFGEWPRPWGPISRGALGGTIAIGVLIVWEQLYPREDSLRDEEKAAIRDEEAAAEAAGDETGFASDTVPEADSTPEAGSPSTPDEDGRPTADEDPRA